MRILTIDQVDQKWAVFENGLRISPECETYNQAKAYKDHYLSQCRLRIELRLSTLKADDSPSISLDGKRTVG